MVDKTLGAKGINARYSLSNVIENLASVFVSRGEVLEDVNFFQQEEFKANPDYRFHSAETMRKCMLLSVREGAKRNGGALVGAVALRSNPKLTSPSGLTA